MTAISSTQQRRYAGTKSPVYASLGLLIGLTALSFAAVLMRLSLNTGMPAMVIAFGRLALASAVLTPFVMRRYRGQLRQLRRSDYIITVFAGILAGIHFVFTASALDYTSVMILQVFINTSPLWVAIMETAFLKARLPRAVWIGLVITLVGGSIIAINGGGSGGEQNTALIGAALALGGAIFGSAYLTSGRKAREKVSVVPYVWMVYGIGAVTVLVIMFVTTTPLVGHSAEGYFWIALVALFPQLLGHSMFNYAVAFFPATLVSISSQIITVTAALIAFFLFAEVPGLVDIFGSLIIAVGVTIAILAQRKRRPRG